MVNFVAAVAYHFCLALPAAFTKPRDHILAEPCICCSPELCSHEVDDLEVGGDVSWRGEAVVAAGELCRDGVGGHGTHDLAAAGWDCRRFIG